MLEYVFRAIIWCFFIYGFISAIKDIVKYYTYKRIEENIKLVMTVKDVENGIESYIREVSFGRNFFNNLVVIDMNSQDETMSILKELQEENFNMKILSKEEGREYLERIIE